MRALIYCAHFVLSAVAVQQFPSICVSVIKGTVYFSVKQPVQQHTYSNIILSPPLIRPELQVLTHPL